MCPTCSQLQETDPWASEGMEWGEDLWPNFSHGSTGSSISVETTKDEQPAPISKVEEIIQHMQEAGKGLDIRSRYSGLTLKKYADCFVGTPLAYICVRSCSCVFVCMHCVRARVAVLLAS